MGKVLIIASVASVIDQFNMPNIKILQQMNCSVSVAASFTFGNTSSQERLELFKKELVSMGIIIYDVPFDRNVFSMKNIKAYRQLKKIIESERYVLIHCHTPIGGVLARLVSLKSRRNGTKMIYTAHGFHFFKGAALSNWLLFYPVERFLARYTDVIITINKEDYERAKKFRTPKIYYIPGVGIATQKFTNTDVDKAAKRRELGIPKDTTVLLSIGELSKRKNHETIVKSISKLNNLNLIYVICGKGSLEIYLRELCIELQISDRVVFIGYRQDIPEILKASDIFAMPSYQEGLPVALMEAMAAGLPIIASKIRGNVDLIEDGVGGFLFSPNDINSFAEGINQLANDNELCEHMSKINVEKIKQFDIQNINIDMLDIYADCISDS